MQATGLFVQQVSIDGICGMNRRKGLRGLDSRLNHCRFVKAVNDGLNTLQAADTAVLTVSCSSF